MNKQQTVFVGLSGGVDSSVAAKRLVEQGYKVVGVFIKVWHPDFLVCNWEQERLDAMRVAAHLDIPFLTCDAEKEYRDEVAKYFIEEYKAGHTPNPDVMCNQHVKFGAFLRFAKQNGADLIATGHYAKKINGELHRGVDNNKDQTYFLWTLSKEQLDCSLFPIGDTPKDEVRREAEAAGLYTASKEDSQGICFLGQVDIPEFLSHYVELKEGNVLNERNEVVGTHKGALVYTLGQRHGFVLQSVDTSRNPMFVVAKNIKENTITVSDTPRTLASDETVKLTNVVLRDGIKRGDMIQAQFGYRQKPLAVKITEVKSSELELKLQENIRKPAGGQSCVLYQATLCLGGGRIA